MQPRLPDMDLGELSVFVQVVQAGSFTRAAKNLGMPKSTVSRKLNDLEQRLAVRLLQRTTRSLSLTDAGQAFYEHCVVIVGQVEEARAAVSQLQTKPRGILRVTAPLTFAILGPVLTEYMRLYPEVKVELLSTDRKVDLVEERFDLAIRAGGAADSSLVMRKLGVIRRCLMAAPNYLEGLGPLESPLDLRDLACVVFSAQGSMWKLKSSSKSLEIAVEPQLSVNDYDVLKEVVRSGFGVGLLPDVQCLEDLRTGRLVRVLPEWSGEEIPILALYPSARHLAPKVLSFLDLLKARLDLSAISPPLG